MLAFDRLKGAHIDLRRLEPQGQFRAPLPAPVGFSRQRRSRNIADDVAHDGATRANCQLGADASKAPSPFAVRRRGDLGEEAERPQQTGPAQVDAAGKLGRRGGARQGALELGTAAARHADPQLLDLELVPDARDGKTDAADRLAAEVGLVDRQRQA